jgi:predicted AlkP superfamily pyrophosphatase or phosphodiesterase
MLSSRIQTLLLAAALALCVLCPKPTEAQHPGAVLMVSIDGMRPDYVTHADEHGLRIPNLRRFVAEGAYATGVRGVYPTVTYPSHTTLVTGVPPSRHGILNNQIFDPERRFDNAWYWYADEIKVPTLWDAAHAAGLRTASVSWPVTVDASSIDDNLPEYWRGSLTADGGSPQDRYLMQAVSRPDGALGEMESRLGPYMKGNETTIDGDRVRTMFAVDMLRRDRPGFMTVHLSSLDEEEHLHGPFSAEANADLEQIDGLLGDLIFAARQANRDAAIVVVSDHGFAQIHDAINLFVPFEEAGLITLEKRSGGTAGPMVQSWTAEPWILGCMAAIMLHHPDNTATRDQVGQLLDKLAADPANGIEKVLTGDEARQLGTVQNAAFLVLFRVGFAPSPNFTGPLVTPTPGRGTHGYAPDHPEMYSSFFAMGPRISAGRNLGLINMLQIAPTIAQLLRVPLPTAEGKLLSLSSGPVP